MVIDYREAWRAADAQRILARAGVAALYTPDKLVSVSPDPTATLWVFHRLEVQPGDGDRARAILDEIRHVAPAGPGHLELTATPLLPLVHLLIESENAGWTGRGMLVSSAPRFAPVWHEPRVSGPPGFRLRRAGLTAT